MTHIVKLLVIDDEANICEGVKRALKPLGYSVDSAISGQVGLEKVRAGGYNLVLLDVMMPDISGIDLIPALHQHDPEIICIIITGYATVELAIKAIKRGAYDFLTKPFSVDELILAVNQGLEHQKLLLESRRMEAAEAEARHLALEKAHLEELDRAKRLFLRLMTHELQAPLSAIQSYLQLLLEGYVPEEKRHETLEKCLRRVEDEKKLIYDLMELGRLQAIGPADEEHLPTQLDEALQEVVNEAREQAEQKQVELKVEIQSPIPPVNSSPKLMKSLWENLVGNALKYTPSGGEVTASLRVENGELVGEVSDTGIGIPIAEQGRLFSEFFRARNAKALNLGGTGLGLVIVKRIVEGAGGKLQVESEAGCGARFSFRLPVSAEAIQSQGEKI